MLVSLLRIRYAAQPETSFSDDGGWAREVTQRELPITTTLAGVNMRLKPGAVRGLHWHKQAEWTYLLQGSARTTVVDQERHPVTWCE
jgi:oxalate decarboxylase/phosphoglucose isomerase-like protein (cupin superfamily)